MKCCCTEGYYTTRESTHICRGCCCEVPVIEGCNYSNCGFDMSHSPFLSGYSRTKRFRGLCEMLFHPTPSNPDEPMLVYLFERSAQLSTVTNILETMSSSKIKDKRFCSLHLFCKLFEEGYEAPVCDIPITQVLKQMTWYFQEIELRYKSMNAVQAIKVPFINYTFIITYILRRIGLYQYLKFLKQLKCKKRIQKYKIMLKGFKLSF